MTTLFDNNEVEDPKSTDPSLLVFDHSIEVVDTPEAIDSEGLQVDIGWMDSRNIFYTKIEGPYGAKEIYEIFKIRMDDVESREREPGMGLPLVPSLVDARTASLVGLPNMNELRKLRQVMRSKQKPPTFMVIQQSEGATQKLTVALDLLGFLTKHRVRVFTDFDEAREAAFKYVRNLKGQTEG